MSSDIFSKLTADVKLSDLYGDFGKPKVPEAPSQLDAFRAAGVGPRQQSNTSSLMRLLQAQQKAFAKTDAVELPEPLPGVMIVPGGPPPALPSFDQFKPAGFDTLEFNKQTELYEQYVSQAASTLKRWNPSLDLTETDAELRTKYPAPQKQPGDFARGLQQYIPQTKGVLSAAAGLALSKLGAEESGAEWLTQAETLFTEANKLARDNDQFLNAIKPEGSLADWAQYTAGSLVGNMAESLAVAALGGVGGAAVGSAAAPGPGTAGGGITAAVGSTLFRTLAKKELRDAAEAELAALARKGIRSGLSRKAAIDKATNEVQRKMARETGKATGQISALLAAASTRGLGEVTQQAQQAGIDPATLPLEDVALGTLVYGLAETIGDKVMLGAFGKTVPGSLRDRLTRGGLVARTATGAAVTAPVEGTTEVVQDIATSLAGARQLPELEQMANAWFAGAFGGGAAGGAGAALRGGSAAQTPPPAQPSPATSVLGTPPAAPPAASETAPAGPDAALAALRIEPLPSGNFRVRMADGSWNTIVAENPEQALTDAMALAQQEQGLAESTARAAPTAVQPAPIEIVDPDVQPELIGLPVPTPLSVTGGQPELIGLVPAPAAVQPAPAPAPAATPASTPATIDELEALLAPLVAQLETQPFIALQQATQLLRNAPLDVRRAIQGRTGRAAIDRFSDTLGMEQTLDANPDMQWANRVRQSAPARDILAALYQGPLTRALSGRLINAFVEANVPYPAVRFDPNPASSARGSYNAETHTVTFNPRTSANTVLHEITHALTVRGMNRVIAQAAAGDQTSRDVLALLQHMHTTLRQATGGRSAYGVSTLTSGRPNFPEMYAELVRPEFLALAANTPLGTLSPEAQAGLRAIGPATTLLDAIKNITRYILRLINPSSDPSSMVDALERTAAFFAAQTAEAFAPSTTQPASSTTGQMRFTRNLLSIVAQLPEALRGARLNYQNRRLLFDNPVHLAAYIARPESRAARRDDYRAWLSSALQLTDAEIAALIGQVAARVRQAAISQPGDGAITVTARESAAAPTAAQPAQSTDAAPLAELANQRQAFRGLQRGVYIGRLVPADVSEADKRTHFLNAAVEGARQAGLDITVRQDGSGFSIINPANRNEWGSVSYANGVASAYTQPLSQGSGVGYKFYDAVYGAAVSARVRFSYSSAGLSSINVRRLPLNRLRAALKWGSITGDMQNAVEKLGLNEGRTLQLMLDTVRTFVRRAQREATLTPELDAFTINGERVTFEDMRQRTATRNTTDQEAASFNAVMLTAMANYLSAATPEARAAAIQRFNSTPIFTEVFSLDDGPVESAMTETPAESAAKEQEVVDQGVDNVTDRTPIRRRNSYDEVREGIQAGERAAPATPARGFIQAAEAAARAQTPEQRRAELGKMRRAASSLGDWLNEKLADHLLVVKRWIQYLPEHGNLTPLLKQSVLGALYRAPGVRDELMRAANKDHGGERVNKLLAGIVSKYKLTQETAKQLVGTAITAMYIPDANAKLLRKANRKILDLQAQLRALDAQPAESTEIDTSALSPEARAAVQNAPEGSPSPQRDALMREIVEATRASIQLAQAINNPQVRNVHHAVGVAGGMNNAQAAALLRDIESRISQADIRAVAEEIYSLNAWRLAVDVESGKATPAVVARFLENQSVRKDLELLRDLAASQDATDPDSLRALEAQRAKVVADVRSRYVPLTGDPNAPIDDELFYQGSRAPNTAADRTMRGRNSFADDAISTTFASVNKSATYAGWRDFQDGIAAVYRALSPEEREAAGIRRTVTRRRGVNIEGAAARAGANAIVRRRGGRTEVYDFKDPKFLESIRGINRDDTNTALQGVGSVTRAYAYAATQLNPFFAPFNFFRDSWERSELVRTRTYLDAAGQQIDSSKIANGMLGILTTPTRSLPLTKMLWRWGFNMKSLPSYEADMLTEFMAEGGTSLYSATFSAERKKLIADITAQKGGPRAALRMIGDLVQNYNRPFDVAPALAAYMSMRENGMTAKDAAAGSLDLMNFRKRGTWSPWLRALYAFSGPTFTGAANSLGALYDPVKGRFNKVGLTRLAGYTLVFGAAQAFLRSLADEDEGGNKLDQESPFLQNNYMLIPFGDGIIKVPLAYGLTRLANGIARAAVGIASEEQTLGEAFGRVMSGSVVPIFSPLEDSDIDWTERPIQALMTQFAPSVTKPIVAVGNNTTPWGTKVVNDKWEDTTRYRSEQFGQFIPEDYKAIAQFIRQSGGPDFAPEEVRSLIRGYPTGVFNLILTGLVENPMKEKDFSDAFTSRFYAEHSEYARYFQFKKALDDSDDQLRAKDADESYDAGVVKWRAEWDNIDRNLRNEKAAVTRKLNSKKITPTAAQKEYDKLDELRRQQQYLMLYRYRTAAGKPAERTEIPSMWAPKPPRKPAGE